MIETKKYVTSDRIHPRAQRWYELAPDRGAPTTDDFSWWWAWDGETNDYLPINKPCDACGRECTHVFTCEGCSIATVMAWELEGTVQDTYRLLYNALTNKNNVDPRVHTPKQWRAN